MNTKTITKAVEVDLEIEIMELCTCDGPWGQQGCDLHRDQQSTVDVVSVQDELYWLGQHY